MPELPEVELARRYLEGSISGRRVAAVEVIDPRIIEGVRKAELRRSLTGKEVGEVRRHGKQLFVMLREGGCLTMHLGMTGDLVFSQSIKEASRHDRFMLEFQDGSALALNDQRLFGAVSWASSMERFIESKRLGPDALQIGDEDFVARLGAHHKAIKTALLDQHVLAGVGNLYADEALFQARLHPSALACALHGDLLSRLWADIKRVMRRSISVQSDFSRLPRTYLLRDRAAGAACPRRNGELETVTVNGRTSIFCPACQSPPGRGN